MEKYLLNWKNYGNMNFDVGGTMFDICPYCGGKKQFTKGMDDWGDNTEQNIICTFCGWKGYRSIKYSSSPWDSSVKTTYSHSILLKFDDEVLKQEEILDVYKQKIGVLHKLVVMKLAEFRYKLYYGREEIKALNNIKINWKEEKVEFNFTQIKPFTLKFDKANILLSYLGLLNYELTEDFESIMLEINKGLKC